MLLKDQLKPVALGLQPIVDEFVFVGGAVVECYVTKSGAEEARQTDDIDVVVELAHYGKYGALQLKLLAGGFNPDSTSRVICRYKFKGITVDIMPDNKAILGFSNMWYTDGIRHAQSFPLDDITIKIFPAPIYLASKIEAYRQRGALSLIPINVSGEIGDITSEGSLNSLKMNSKFLFGLYLTVFLLYSSILESSKLQGTLGKWFLRYKVCDTEFNRISFPKALLRNLLKVISILSLIGVVIIDMTPKRQGLHDLIVRTVLIRK